MKSSVPRRVVLAGGSGQVGTLLARHFQEQGDAVVVLSRKSAPAAWRVTEWDAANCGAWIKELESADLLVNLAGRNVNCRYTPANRREILESRVRSTRVLGEAIAKLNQPPRLWLNASTATIYRHALDRPMDEASGELGGNEPGAPATWNFSIEVAKRWEEAFFASDLPGTRKVALRSAMVMSPGRGGIFDVLLGLVRFGLGGSSGNGRQFVSWIHEGDFIAAIEFLVARENLCGAVNLASPNPLPNAEFMRALRSAWGTPIGLGSTKWMLEIGALFLRTEAELILKSRQVVPGRLRNAGFHFQFPHWPQAAQELIRCWKNPSKHL
ncbi:MAG: TIGR01777 family oxidoreductase [Candidatus Acidiferrum sp.]|jgi:uncharacterized protein (TIGR01777 family)